MELDLEDATRRARRLLLNHETMAAGAAMLALIDRLRQLERELKDALETIERAATEDIWQSE